MAKSKWEDIKKKLESIETWASVGLSERQIAKNLGISKSTFEKYKSEHSDFLAHLKRGKETADSQVENALYKRAVGYTIVERQPIKCKETFYNEDGKKCEKENVVVVETEKEVPADVGAIKFWLVNRQRDRWKDNPHKVIVDRENLKLKKKEIESRDLGI